MNVAFIDRELLKKMWISCHIVVEFLFDQN